MTRDEAIIKLRLLVGKDLRPLADEYGVAVWKSGRKNKGWAGSVLERFLGLEANSRQAPDFGNWDLKLVSLKRSGAKLVVKETMAITMLQPAHVIETFEHSHLLDKLQRLVVAAGNGWMSRKRARPS